MREKLKAMAEEKYRRFAASLLPPKTKMLGVRLPKLRDLAKQMAKQRELNKWRAPHDAFMEEKMLEGMIIGYADLSFAERAERVQGFVPKIDNWSVCDSFCCGLKIVKGNEDDFLEFLMPYLYSKKEFEVRFGVVILLDYYINEKYIDTVLEILDAIQHDGYYAKMAVAWAVSMCYVKYPQKTFRFLKKTSLNSWTVNKSIQKITESLKVDSKSKQKIVTLKRS